MNPVRFSPTMKKAWFYLSWYFFSLSLLHMLRAEGDLGLIVVLVLLCLVTPPFLLYLIAAVRGPHTYFLDDDKPGPELFICWSAPTLRAEPS